MLAGDSNSNCFIFSQVLRDCHGFQSQSQLFAFLKSYAFLVYSGQQLLAFTHVKDQRVLKKVELQTLRSLIDKFRSKEHKEAINTPDLFDKQTHGQTANLPFRYYQASQIQSLTQNYPFAANPETIEARKRQINETNPLQITSRCSSVLISQIQSFEFQKNMKLKGGGCGSHKAVNIEQSKQQTFSQVDQQVSNQKNAKKAEEGIEVLQTENQKIYQEGLQLLTEGLSQQKMELILQGIQTIKKSKLTNINDPLVLINQFIDIFSHKYTEGWSQLLKEQLVQNLPELLDMLLQKNEDKKDFFISEETKRDLTQKISAGLKLVNQKRIGSPELAFYLRYSLMILENIPDNKDSDYFGIFCKVIKVAQ